MQEHQRRLIAFLEGYGAQSIHIKPGGKHDRLRFRFKDHAYERIMAKSPSDHRSLDNEIAAIRRLLGEPIHEHAHAQRSLEDLTMELNNNAQRRTDTNKPNGIHELAANALSPITTAAQRNLNAIVERGFPVAFADAVTATLDEHDNSVDLVFTKKRKSISDNGKVVATREIIVAINLPMAALVAAFEPLNLVSKPEPVPAPMPLVEHEQQHEKPRRQWATPRGADEILRLAQLLTEIRQQNAETGGGNHQLHALYKKHGFSDMSPNVITDLRIISGDKELQHWLSAQPKTKFINSSPRMILGAWEDERKLRLREEKTAKILAAKPALVKTTKAAKPAKAAKPVKSTKPTLVKPATPELVEPAPVEKETEELVTT